jgi:hypothetical protein
MMKLTAIGAISLMASGLFAQGMSPGGQSKDSWEEINFEFNSSILSDGYPSLLRLADVLTQHTDYKVRVTGNTDSVGSAAYNEKLAMSRAESVKAFLLKYGASATQISTASDGKRDPEVDNKTKEGRFMNRRVVLTITDATGKVIGTGGISDVLPALQAIQDMAKKQEECCTQILKRLDKLDDILAALKALQGDNDRLKTEVADLRNQQNGFKDQITGMPKAITEPQAQAIVAKAEPDIASAAAKQVAEDVKANNHRLSNVGINIGPAFGNGRANNSHVSASANGQFFSPFGADGTYAVQAQGEYMYSPGIQEGQFDLGLVNRIGSFQAGGFASFKYVNFGQYQQGGVLGQADFLADYLFAGGKVGVFGTKGFKNYAVLNSVELAPGAFMQTYARVDDQVGFDATVGAWGKAYVQGNIGVLFAHNRSNAPGFTIKLVQPIVNRLAFTAELGYNETFLNSKNSGAARFGLLFGGIMNPKDFAKITTPVPMDVPRVHYELGTRRVGSSPPVADAGPNQLNVPAAVITLDGSGSYDPLGLALTYSWVQISGPSVTITGATSPKATFPATSGNTYAFRLTVKNTDGLQASATTTVSTTNPGLVTILVFQATPSTVAPGGSSTLNWVVQNATSVTISPGPGSVNATSGSVSVTPTATTTYTLTATGPAGTVPVNATTIVTVSAVPPGNPQIIRYDASPLTISTGQSSTLSWTTTGASAVNISGLGSEPLNGSASVSPTTTTTYTLTATSSDGHAVTAPITVTVTTTTTIPQVVVFSASPQTISAGQSSQLCWQVNNATTINISGGVGSNVAANSCATVSPQTTTTYVLTATNAAGQIQASATVNVGSTQILQFSANPEFSPIQGGAVVLTWQTTNATSVSLVGGDMQSSPSGLPVNGSFTVNPMDNATYTLIAYGPGGSSVSAVIAVYVR